MKWGKLLALVSASIVVGTSLYSQDKKYVYPDPIPLVVNTINPDEQEIRDPRYYVRPTKTKELLEEITLQDNDYDKALKLWNFVLDNKEYRADYENLVDNDFRHNYWQTPEQTMKEGKLVGDSEDLSCVLASMMIQAGIPRNRVGVATNTVNVHSWVNFFDDGKIYILDSTLDFRDKPSQLFTEIELLDMIDNSEARTIKEMYPVSPKIPIWFDILVNNDVDAYLDMEKYNYTDKILWGEF
jgi:hypothetical protein